MTNSPAAAALAAATKINHTACYEAKIHASTSADRALCRGLHREGKKPTKAMINKARAEKAAKNAAPTKITKPKKITPDPATDDPYDEADAS